MNKNLIHTTVVIVAANHVIKFDTFTSDLDDPQIASTLAAARSVVIEPSS